MWKYLLALLVLVAAPVAAQPIHGHPQKAAYGSPAEWPTVSAQGHWLINGDLAHLHVDLTCPLYAEVHEGDTVTCQFAVVLHHFPGRVSDAAAGWTGLFGYAHTVRWDATGSETFPVMIGDPTGDRTFTGSLTIETKIGITGWWPIQLDVAGLFDNGDQIRVRHTECLWVITPGVTGNGQASPFVESHATFFQAARPERGWGDTQTGLLTYLPLAPISVPWPVLVNGLQYRDNGAIPLGPFHGTLEQRVDLDLHHGIPGTTIYGPVTDPLNVVVAFNPAVGNGLHKYALFWNAPIEEQLASSLIVNLVTVDPNAPPIAPDLTPTPPPPPPPPPPPVESWIAGPTIQQLLINGVLQDRFRLCSPTPTHCVELLVK